MERHSDNELSARQLTDHRTDSVTHRETSSVNQLFQNYCIFIDISDLPLQGEEKRQK